MRIKYLEAFIRKQADRLSSMSLRMKLLLSYILIMAIPSLIFGIYTNNNTQKSLIEGLAKNGQQSLQRMLGNINRNAEINEMAIQILLSNKTFLDAIPDIDRYSVEQLLELQKGAVNDISRIRNVNPSIYRLCVYTKGNVEFFSTLYNEGRIAGAPFYNDIIRENGMNLWVLAYPNSLVLQMNPSNENTITSLFRVVKDDRNQDIGIVEVSMLARDFFSDLYINAEDEGSFICVLDETGNVIFNEKAAAINKMNLSQSILYESLSGISKEENDFTQITLNGEPVVVNYSYSRKINATIYLVSYIELLAKDIKSAQFNTILQIIIIFVILTVITFAVTSALLKKVRIMQKYMKKIQIGDLSVSLPPLGNDEIGELAKNFQQMMNQVNELITLKFQNQEAIKNAELNALSAQINSHFTYNTLDTIQMMAEIDEKYEIADAVNLLGKIMRYGIYWGSKNSTLREELGYLKNYISLINIKFNELVELCIYVNEGLLSAKVPKMILQPLAENCVFHGIKGKGVKGIISIDAVVKGSDMLIEVFDNGKGISRDTLLNIQTMLDSDQSGAYLHDSDSIGLLNVHHRVRLYYGKPYGIQVESEEDLFTKVIIRLPYSDESMEER